MQFKVPQFLEIEDKIFGPFTFRQFIYIVGGVGLCYILYKVLGFWLSSVPIIIIGGLAFALAFYRPNNKPFINMLESVFKFTFQNKLYIWKRRKAAPGKARRAEAVPATFSAPEGGKLSEGKLRDLAWSLDVLDLSKRDNNNLENK